MSVEKVGSGGISNLYGTQKSSTSGKVSFSNILDSASSNTQTDLDSIFEAAAEKYNIPVNLLKAVAKAESSFNPNAVSPSGAVGIMQLMPGTAAYLGVTDSYDPYQNIMGGAKYLREMLDEFGGDVKLALAAYNAGPDAVEKYDGIPPYQETQNYVTTVLGYYGENITAGTVSSALNTHASGLLNTSAPYVLQNVIKRDTSSSGTLSLSDTLLINLIELQMKMFDDLGGSGDSGL